MMNQIPPAPPLPAHLAADRSGPAWAWWANCGAATALALLILAIGGRVVRYINNADDHLDYEALGFAQLFGVVGLVLLAPLLIGAVSAAICAICRTRAAFVLNIVVGPIALSVAAGQESHEWVMVVPAAAIVVAIAGWIAVGSRRDAP